MEIIAIHPTYPKNTRFSEECTFFKVLVKKPYFRPSIRLTEFKTGSVLGYAREETLVSPKQSKVFLMNSFSQVSELAVRKCYGMPRLSGIFDTLRLFMKLLKQKVYETEPTSIQY